jgi:hypothetical protein
MVRVHTGEPGAVQRRFEESLRYDARRREDEDLDIDGAAGTFPFFLRVFYCNEKKGRES